MIQRLIFSKQLYIFAIGLAVGLFSFCASAQDLSAAQAADLARKQAGGGKILKVKPFDTKKQGYRVRILTEGGQVKELFIPNQKVN